ncbi:MAG: hypothetical protein GKR95_04345 [Gammaproteobacteria bacterium]|nr:hypothetical protein [Gammaproteobacteria bacterium]
MLNKTQLKFYKKNGFVIVPNVISSEKLDSLQQKVDEWTSESRNYDRNYGKLIDGRARFDLEKGHSRTKPKLRRINNPIEISNRFRDVVLHGTIPSMLTPILGQDIKFDHCKINAKYPGMSTKIDYHQDHAFEPQTNDSVLVTLLMLDDATIENGCLQIVSGSHHKPHSHYQNNEFTGKVSDAVMQELKPQLTPIVAKAGSLCIMNTWSIHGSGPNMSHAPRRILITEYKAADAFPLVKHKLPSLFMDSIILGEASSKPGYRKGTVELPPYYKDTSFIEVQTTRKAS